MGYVSFICEVQGATDNLLPFYMLKQNFVSANVGNFKKQVKRNKNSGRILLVAGPVRLELNFNGFTEAMKSNNIRLIIIVTTSN